LLSYTREAIDVLSVTAQLLSLATRGAGDEYYALFFAEGSAWVWIDAPEQVIVQIAP